VERGGGGGKRWGVERDDGVGGGRKEDGRWVGREGGGLLKGGGEKRVS